jgi:phosphoribosylanthranilate isomerase
MTRIKICGVTDYDNALMCAQAGADMLGLNFYRQSPRYIERNQARELCDRLRDTLGDSCPLLVGVFVNATVGDVSVITNHVGLDAAQLSGDESDNMVAELHGMAYKAIRPMNKTMALEDVAYYQAHFPTDERLPSILLDAYHPSLYGGTGESASVEVALAVKEQVLRMMLAGGLNPDNVAERVTAIRPWGVDIASGVEDGVAGMKSPEKVQALIQAVRGVE